MRGRILFTLVAVTAVIVCLFAVMRYGDREAPHPVEPAAAVPAVNPTYLPDTERKFLWKCEHRGNVLSNYGWRSIREAIQQCRLEALVEALTGDFQAIVTDSPRDSRFKNDFLAVGRGRRPLDGGHKLDRLEFANWLLDLRRRFDDQVTVQFATVALRPVSRTDLNGNWQGRCRLRMSGLDDAKGPQEIVVTFRFTTTAPTKKAFQAGRWWSTCEVTQIDSAHANQVLMQEVAADRGFLLNTLYDN